VSKEPVVLINLPKRSNGKPSNVTVRGTSALGLSCGRRCADRGPHVPPGTSEIIAGRSVASGFRGAALGETLRFAQRDWVVVGVFDSDKTAFDSARSGATPSR
jgi:putative ABC transport system permease protein